MERTITWRSRSLSRILRQEKASDCSGRKRTQVILFQIKRRGKEPNHSHVSTADLLSSWHGRANNKNNDRVAREREDLFTKLIPQIVSS